MTDQAMQAASLRRLADELDPGPAAVDWTRLTPDQDAELRTELIKWIETKLVPMYGEYLDQRLRGCWRNHPAVCTEIGQLHAEWSRIFDRDQPSLAGALSFSDRLLPAALGRIAPLMANCNRAQGCATARQPAISGL